MEKYVEEKYREFLRIQGRVNDLIDVDVVSAIDILAERGQWETALSTAKQQNVYLFRIYILVQSLNVIFGNNNFNIS